MGLQFEDVSFEMIGRGGGEEDHPLVMLVDEEIQRLSNMVLEYGREDKATVTITVTIKAESDNGVVLGGKVVSKEPARSSKALSALVTPDGRVMTAEHKQEPLFSNVTPIGKEGSNA